MLCSWQVEHALQRNLDRRIVGMAVHDIAHEGPPALHDLSIRQFVELVVVRTGENAKEVMVLGIEPDGIIGNTSILERSDQLGEYLVMAFFVFGRLTGIEIHAESYAFGHYVLLSERPDRGHGLVGGVPHMLEMASIGSCRSGRIVGDHGFGYLHVLAHAFLD